MSYHTPDYYRRRRYWRTRLAPARDRIDRAMWRWIGLWVAVSAVLAVVRWLT